MRATLDDGPGPRSRRRIEAMADPDAWLEGHGWDSDRWGGWPTAADLETVAPGRRGGASGRTTTTRCSPAARRSPRPASTADTPDPPGGVIGRDEDGEPDGMLYEAATRRDHGPHPADVDRRTRGGDRGRRAGAAAPRASSPPTTRAMSTPDPDLGWAYPAYARLSERGACRSASSPRSATTASTTALAGGLRSGDILGADPDGRARIGWQKCFADGSLGSRTAALLADIEPEPDRPLAEDRRRGVWIDRAEALRELVDRAAAGGIATQIHAIGDAAVRAALDALDADRRPPSRSCPRSSTSSCSIRPTRPRFAAAGIVASVQPVHLRSDAAPGTPAVGRPRRAERLRLGARSRRPGRSSRSGRMRRSSRSTRGRASRSRSGARIRRWPAGTPAVRPGRGADRSTARSGPPASIRPSPRGERRPRPADRRPARRRRVIPAAAIDEPVEPGGALATAPAVDRPRRRPGRLRALGRLGRRPVASSSRSASANSPLKMRDVDGKAWIVSARTSIVHVRPDRDDAFVDRRRGVRAGHRGADELARRPVDHDRHVAERGLDRVALGARREVGDELERVDAGLARRLERVRRPTTPRGPCRSPAAAPGSRARRPRRAPSGPRARPGSAPGGCGARGRPGRR